MIRRRSDRREPPAPPFPKIAVEVNKKADQRLNRIRFTGWKSDARGFVGQYIWYNPKDENVNAYVSMPGLVGGCFKKGSTFEIGNERFQVNTPAGVIERAAEAGYEKIQLLVAECCKLYQIKPEDGAIV